MATEQSSDRKNMNGDTDENKQPGTSHAEPPVESRTETAENKSGTPSVCPTKAAFCDFLHVHPKDLPVQRQFFLGAPFLYALVYFAFLSSSFTWQDRSFLVPLLIIAFLGYLLDLGKAQFEATFQELAQTIKEVSETMKEVNECNRARIREFQTLRHRENLIKLEGFVEKGNLFNGLLRMVQLQLGGHPIHVEQMQFLEAKLLLNLEENLKLVAVAEKIEEVFTREAQRPEEDIPLSTEIEIGDLMAVRDSSSRS